MPSSGSMSTTTRRTTRCGTLCTSTLKSSLKVSQFYVVHLLQKAKTSDAVFMSSNLITGFHSRLEGSRKYLFGNAGVYGKANDSKIQGVYLVRGAGEFSLLLHLRRR